MSIRKYVHQVRPIQEGFLEPAIKNHIYKADNRERLIRAKRSDPDW